MKKTDQTHTKQGKGQKKPVLHPEEAGKRTGEKLKAERCTGAQVETALRFARLAFDHFTDSIVWFTKETGRVVYVNETSCTLLGYSRAELLSLTAFDIIPDISPEDWRKNFGLLKKRRSIRFEAVQKASDGRMVPVEITANYLELDGQVYNYAVIRDISERKRAEQALRASEERYRLLIENSDDSILLTAPDGRILAANPAACRMFQHSEAEICRLGRNGLVDTTDLKLSTALAERESIGKARAELTYIRGDGQRFPGETTSVIFQGENGQPRTSMIIRDTSNHKQAEEALRESEERLSRLVETIPDGITIVNREGEIIFANPAAEKIFGLQRSEVTDRVYNSPAWKITAPNGDPFPEAQLPFVRVMQAHQPVYGVEHAIEKPDGTRVVLSINAAPLQDSQGNWTGMIAALTDITARKQAEEALAESEARHRAIIEDQTELICRYLPGGKVTYVNQAYCRYFGKEPDEIIGNTFYPLIVEEDRVKVQELLATLSPENPVVTVEERVILPDNQIRWQQWVSRLILDAQNQVKEIQAVGRDITEHKRMEEALRVSRGRLSHLSRRLVEVQEEERRRIARELHDEIGQTLTALNISLESAAQNTANDAMRDSMAGIQALSRSLITQVSALSSELRPRVLDDLGLVPGLIALFNRLSTQVGLTIDFKHTGMEKIRLTPEIEMTTYRIVQEALTNIVRHANVKTASVRLQAEGNILYIQVQDEGKGFDLNKALEAESSFGLLNMMERAGQIGGLLELETAPGEGTLLTCQLPLDGKYVERRKHERRQNRPGG